MADNKGILVVGEAAEGKLLPITAEILGAGRKLADELKEPLCCIIIGAGLGDTGKAAVAAGADKVFLADDAQLKDYENSTYMQVMEKAVAELAPKIIIMGQTANGRDLAPRLAFKLGVSAVMDCLELAIDGGKLQCTRPVYGGNAKAIFTSDAFPQIATLRVKAGTPLAPDAGRAGEVAAFAVALDASKIKAKVLETVKEEVAGGKIEDAAAVVGGGRGLGGPEPFTKELAELAKILKGAVGASRPPCDNKWVPDSIQIGLTGKIIAPELYIAIGISGSSQHMSGCSGAKCIVAINKDPEANIFKEARFGVVGDWKVVLPAFTAKVKELVS
ncbi:MAG: electron transfer flavoprotein subunit alpha/FixB family protein [Dehalococcoidia bacterium]|nr:electron transfer flavoprotein subunit alpha/FixB family protein [Dehalococcoidia bacterium]